MICCGSLYYDALLFKVIADAEFMLFLILLHVTLRLSGVLPVSNVLPVFPLDLLTKLTKSSLIVFALFSICCYCFSNSLEGKRPTVMNIAVLCFSFSFSSFLLLLLPILFLTVLFRTSPISGMLSL